MLKGTSLILSTSRLHLRKPVADDRNWIFALNHDPLWLRFIGNRGVHTLKDANRYIDNVLVHFENHGYGLFAVVDKLTGKPVSYTHLTLPTNREV